MVGGDLRIQDHLFKNPHIVLRLQPNTEVFSRNWLIVMNYLIRNLIDVISAGRKIECTGGRTV